MTELENSLNEEKLLSLVEELQTENEQQQSQIEQLQTLIQKHSSEKRELALTIAEQQKRIAEQKEKIEKLNESDKELLKSKQLLNESGRKLSESQERMITAEALRDKAQSEMEQARQESYQARAKSEALQLKIDEGVKREASRMEAEKARIIKSNNIDHYAKVGSLTVALSLYCCIITAVWLKDHGAVLKTVPEWFVSRWHNLQSIWGGIISVYTWAYKLLEPHMNDFIAKAIPFVLVLAIVALIAYFGVWKGFWWLEEKWSDLWSHYRYQSKKLLKASVTVAIITVSIPIAVFVVEVTKLPHNVLSWWLILSLVLNVAYHTITYKLW